jgi:hypothetical protein
MPRSKASEQGDDHLHEFQLLKQDVQENQHEISAMRAELSSVSTKQDQVNHAVAGMQGTINDINSQMLSMAETLKVMRLSNSGKQSEHIPVEPSAEEHTSLSHGLSAEQQVLLQKCLEVEALRRQYTLEQELSRCYQQQLPAIRRSAPPGFGRQFLSTHPTDPEPDHHLQPGQHSSSGQANPWQKYQKDYEQEMRTQFLKNMTKGPHLDFPKFEGGNPVEWIRQCEKCF